MREISVGATTKAFPSILNHLTLLGDKARVGAFRAAIKATVRPGNVVVDAGTGTGVLAFFAVQAGARRVYAIEETDLIDVARALARENDLDDRLVFIRGNSLRVALPERAHVLITETLGHLPVEEGILAVVADARRRLLRRRARIIPQRIDTYLVPLEGAALRQELVGYWERRIGGLDLSAARRGAANRIYKGWIEEAAFLAKPSRIWMVRLNAWNGGGLRGVTVFSVRRAGLLVGFGGWFEASLSHGIALNTFRGTTWRNFVLPLERPVEVARGDRIRVTFRLEERKPGYRLRWEGMVSGRRGDTRFAQASG